MSATKAPRTPTRVLLGSSLRFFVGVLERSLHRLYAALPAPRYRLTVTAAWWGPETVAESNSREKLLRLRDRYRASEPPDSKSPRSFRVRRLPDNATIEW